MPVIYFRRIRPEGVPAKNDAFGPGRDLGEEVLMTAKDREDLNTEMLYEASDAPAPAEDQTLIHPLSIGGLRLPNNIFLAPMAGVTDNSFRLLCHEQGAGFCFTEMISAKGVHYNGQGSLELARVTEAEGPVGVQIFGSDPEIMGEAAERFAELGAPLIDINMGCPVRKVAGNGEGSALLESPVLAERIVEAVRRRSGLPVSVKLRRGFYTGKEMCVECAQAAEQGGAAMITVHGRYREEFYSGHSDWSAVERVKRAVSVPVILSGDVLSREDALAAMSLTGADGVMIGRGAMGDPWLFRRIVNSGPAPSPEERRLTVLRHMSLLNGFKGEETAVAEMRKHIIWYVKGLRGSSKFRAEICSARDLGEACDRVNLFFDSLVSL